MKEQGSKHTKALLGSGHVVAITKSAYCDDAQTLLELALGLTNVSADTIRRDFARLLVFCGGIVSTTSILERT